MTRTFLKTLALGVASVGLFALPALAATITIEFVPDEGDAATWTLDDETGMATGPDGVTGTYTWDEDTMTLCGEMEGEAPEELCTTFEDASASAPAVGETARYTTNTGDSGMATIVAMEE